jgi:hypothetical protein
MAAVQLRRFSKPKVLRSIQPSRLRAFLAPFRGYLVRRGFDIPLDEGFDYERLADILMSPDVATPPQLVEALCIVDEMSTNDTMDDLLSEAPTTDGRELSPADVAVDIYLSDPDFLYSKHRERCVERLRSYVVMESSVRACPWEQRPNDARIEALEMALGEWFARHNRSRNVKVFPSPKEDEIWFLVRHGEPYRRDESMEGRTSGTVCYRPVKYDVVVFDRRTFELRISGRSLPLRRLYRTQFGLHLFGDADRFREIPRFTLEPLREDEAASLVCSDVEGIEWIRLREAEITIGGELHYRFVLKARDLFVYLRSHGKRMPQSGVLSWAKFDVKFSDSPRVRSLEIRTPCHLKFKRDDVYALVEEWLIERGFRLNVQEPVLASA